MTLLLHCGAEEIDLPMLESMETPPATRSLLPLPHIDQVRMVKYSLGYFGHEVVEEHHAITREGSRYFGLLTLQSEYGRYTDMVGLRNSHDKSFPIGIAIGSRVFCCDNLAFIGDHVIKRRHTVRAKRDLPGLVAEVVEPLKTQRQRQHQTFARYESTRLDARAADHAILTLFRAGVINIRRVPQVIDLYETPAHDDWGHGTAWTLFNAATQALEGRIAENPQGTRQLHDVIEAVCEAT